MSRYVFGWTDPRGVKHMTSISPGTGLDRPKSSAERKAIQDAANILSMVSDNDPFKDYVISFEFVGSRVTCNPPIMDTDEDILILTDNLEEIVTKCLLLGFAETGSYPGSEFISLKRSEETLNLIITDKKDFYDLFMFATKLATSLNLMAKKDRIILFQAILYGKVDNNDNA